MKIDQKLLKKSKFLHKIMTCQIKIQILKRNIFKILRDLLSDIKNTQNWIIVKFLVH